MNDRFKFRYFDKTDKRTYYGSGFYIKKCCGMLLSLKFFDNYLQDIRTIKSDLQGKINVEIMQCTGLKDKNGCLIYEGDILGGIYEGLYIGYCDNCKQFQLIAKDYGCMACIGDIHWSELVEDNDNIEVIGNIYENKEMLDEMAN